NVISGLFHKCSTQDNMIHSYVAGDKGVHMYNLGGYYNCAMHGAMEVHSFFTFHHIYQFANGIFIFYTKTILVQKTACNNTDYVRTIYLQRICIVKRRVHLL
ncbi:hypothetical protein ACJX0J_008833, partial [Zea mays]